MGWFSGGKKANAGNPLEMDWGGITVDGLSESDRGKVANYICNSDLTNDKTLAPTISHITNKYLCHESYLPANTSKSIHLILEDRS